MTRLKKSLTTLVGLLGCLLAITSCCLFRSPKDPNQIQDPPPTDRNYLACRVNGKPVVFKRVSGPIFRERYSSFSVSKTTTDSLVIKLSLNADGPKKSDAQFNLEVTQEFVVQNNLVEIDKELFDEKEIENAVFTDLNLAPYGFNHADPKLKGSIKITHFEYRKGDDDKFYGRISGVFEFTSRTPYPLQENSHTVRITDGVFNVTLIE